MTRIFISFLLILPCLAHSGTPPGVADLAWMTGSWVGPIGEQTLEETWLQPGNGTMTCVVRITSGGKTNVYEFIVIEEEADSLTFRVRQWQPGFKPLDPPGQTMTLAAIGERRVSFEANGPGNFKTLSYSRPVDDQFHIVAELQVGGVLQIQLRAKP
jgi:hypothetical protein